MAEAMKDYPIGVLVRQNYLQSLHVYIAVHGQTQIINFKSKMQKLLSLTYPCFTHIFPILQHTIYCELLNQMSCNKI